MKRGKELLEAYSSYFLYEGTFEKKQDFHQKLKQAKIPHACCGYSEDRILNARQRLSGKLIFKVPHDYGVMINFFSMPLISSNETFYVETTSFNQ
jgi:hypothetical protein